MALMDRLDVLAQRFTPVPDGAAEIDEDLRERLRVLLGCVGLTVLAMLTRPGEILADTKIDMAVNPMGFLSRALHLWDADQFGQLQNQVAGYLFPMGPFYALGDVLGVPAWITQRLWLAVLLCTAFLGVRRLAARLGIGGPATQLIGGLVYALAPSGQATLGQISAEYMPLAMLPWIVLPLVSAAEGGSRVRAAARSGFAVALCGGINATATVAVLIVPFLYILTRPRAAFRLRTLAWWSAAVASAVAWWLVPLVLDGKYAFSWLTYTEKAATTTGPTGLINILRGGERWGSYLLIDGQPWWPVGNGLSVKFFPVLFTGVIAGLGLAGLVRRRLPESRFLLLTLLAGLFIIVAGHTSSVESPLAPAIRNVLDGVLAPLRNLYKFDALVRLPLAFGLIHLLTVVRRPGARLGVIASAWLALAVTLLPALTNGLSGAGSFPQVPQYWRDAAEWVNSRAGDQAVLALPGSRFGEYTWGRPMDDVMQPLFHTRWGARALVPAGSPGYTRILDAIDERVTAGQGSAGLTEVLGRMGVRYLLVRNDLQRSELRGAWPARIHQALDSSPGIRKVAEFGGSQEGGAQVGGTDPNDGVSLFDQPYAPLEIYEVQGADDIASLVDADKAVQLSGSPEALLAMADNGLLKGRPVLLNGDGSGSGSSVVSDTLRLVQRNFGEIRTQISPTMTSQEGARLVGTASDLLEPGWSRYSTVATYSGIQDITASTSTSDTTSIAQLNDPGNLPYAAMDGNVFTQWETGGWSGPVNQWLKVQFTGPTTPHTVSVGFSQDPLLGPPPDRISVETEAGSIEQPVRQTSAQQTLRVPPGATRWLRIRIRHLAWQPSVVLGSRVGITELNIDGLRPVRHYQLPTVPGPSSYVMTRSTGTTPACMLGSIRWVCSPSLERQDEEGYGFDRIFTAAAASPAVLSGTATLIDPEQIQRYLRVDPKMPVVSGSSSISRDPASQAFSAFDGDPKTTWIAAPQDRTPTFTVTWGHRLKISSIEVLRPPLARAPLAVEVRGSAGDTRSGAIDTLGRLRFAPMTTSRLTITFQPTQLPLQVTDVVLPGVPQLKYTGDTPIVLPCGYGPRIEFNGTTYATKASGTATDLLQSRPMTFEACRTVKVTAGTDHLADAAFDHFRLETVVVDTGGALAAAAPRNVSAVTVTRWTAADRRIDVNAPNRSYLTLNENFNAGWEARIGGHVLTPARLDGWRQAWVVPAGTVGTVELTYTPDFLYRLSLLVGLNLLLVLLIGSVWPWLRGPARTPSPAPRAEPVLRLGVLGLAAVLGLWTAGVPGAAVMVVVVLVGTRAQRSWAGRAVLSPWLVAGSMLVGTLSVAVGMWLRVHGHQSGPGDLVGEVFPQLCGLIIAGRVVAELAREDPPPEPPRLTDLRWRPDWRPRTESAPAQDQDEVPGGEFAEPGDPDDPLGPSGVVAR
ncbi:MAG: coagulation factor 5/8 type domain protein [Actinomycetia bacterium]|nr:coagulation factor 5/8 type domain protein [Actinomycetes bacterium]